MGDKMKIRRIYRNWDNPDCRIQIKHFINTRVMPVFNPHFHNELEIIYFIRGNYEIYKEDGNLKIKDGTIYFVLPDEVHSVRSLIDDGEYISLAIDLSAISMNPEHYFQKCFVQPMQTGGLRLPRMIRNKEPGYEELIVYLEQLRRPEMREASYTLKRFSCVMGFCTELMQYCSITAINVHTTYEESSLAKACVDYMHANYDRELSLELLAAHVHVHPNYLCTVFKKDVGMTILEYLSRVRVERARDLLSRKTLSIAQIAEQCGFRSISTFQRTFKAYTGTTPSKYARGYKMKNKEAV